MDKINSFDNNLKSAANIHSYYIEPSKDIFEEAWIKKDQNIKNKKFSFFKPIKRATLATSLSMIFFCTAILTLSPNARAFAMDAYNNIKTIFTVESSENDYKIVEKSADTPIAYFNYGGIEVKKSNKNVMEKLFGHSFYLPEKIGEDYERHGFPNMNIQVKNIKLNDAVNLKDKFIEAIGNSKVFESLDNYEMHRYVSATYTHTNEQPFWNNKYKIYISTDKRNMSKYKVIKELNINGIDCKILEAPFRKYDYQYYSSSLYLDTQKPKEIVKVNYLIWNYNNIFCKIRIPEKTENFEPVTKLAEEYINALKNSQAN